MIETFKALFSNSPKAAASNPQQTVRLAAAALLIETAKADFSQSDEELDALQALLAHSLGLDEAAVAELVRAAQARAAAATSLYEFTRTLNDHCSAEDKVRLIESMWMVAYADGNADKYEEHLIRKVAELIYVPHSEYIRTKLSAKA